MGQKFAHPVLKKEWSKPVKEGGKVPETMFKTRVRNESESENPFEWKDISSTEMFTKKRIVLFALPGAFTPTCSSTHLPGYEELYDEIMEQAIDEVYCLSVNDAFVMRQWGLKQGLEEDMTPGANGFKKVKLLPDGAAHFTRGMGMSTMWDKERGFGERSWRYAAIFDDMKVEKLFIEGGGVVQNSAEDPFEVSDAKSVLSYLKEVKEAVLKKKAEEAEKAKAKEEEEARKKAEKEAKAKAKEEKKKKDNKEEEKNEEKKETEEVKEETKAEETKEETKAEETKDEETKEETKAEETKEETKAEETKAEETKEETKAEETKDTKEEQADEEPVKEEEKSKEEKEEVNEESEPEKKEEEKPVETETKEEPAEAETKEEGTESKEEEKPTIEESPETKEDVADDEI